MTRTPKVDAEELYGLVKAYREEREERADNSGNISSMDDISNNLKQTLSNVMSDKQKQTWKEVLNC